VFPEEGRSRERTMRPFQRGAFLLALKSEVPILPIAIDGTFDVMPAGRLRIQPGIVTVKIGQVIPTAGLSLRDKQHLADMARAQIERMLGGV
jgi:1-acyl-sn-glycerol-3-phosphate acyltransferase